jgi:F0F1-type ATP synthase assembly protein I
MYWPLIGGFIAFVLLTILIGWLLDNSARRDAERRRH